MIIYSALTKVLERFMAGDPTTVLWLVAPALGVESSHQTPPYYGSLLLIY